MRICSFLIWGCGRSASWFAPSVLQSEWPTACSDIIFCLFSMWIAVAILEQYVVFLPRDRFRCCTHAEQLTETLVKGWNNKLDSASASHGSKIIVSTNKHFRRAAEAGFHSCHLSAELSIYCIFYIVSLSDQCRKDIVAAAQVDAFWSRKPGQCSHQISFILCALKAIVSIMSGENVSDWEDRSMISV